MTNLRSFFQNDVASWDPFENDLSAATTAEESDRRRLANLKAELVESEQKFLQASRLDDVLSKRRVTTKAGLGSDASTVAYSVHSAETTLTKQESSPTKRDAHRGRGRSLDPPIIRISRAERIRRARSGELGRKTIRCTRSGDMSTGAPRLRRTLNEDIGLSIRSVGSRRALSRNRTSRSPSRRLTRQNSPGNSRVEHDTASESTRTKRSTLRSPPRFQLSRATSATAVVDRQVGGLFVQSAKDPTWEAFHDEAGFNLKDADDDKKMQLQELVTLGSACISAEQNYNGDGSGDGLFEVCHVSDSCLDITVKQWLSKEQPAEIKRPKHKTPPDNSCTETLKETKHCSDEASQRQSNKQISNTGHQRSLSRKSKERPVPQRASSTSSIVTHSESDDRRQTLSRLGSSKLKKPSTRYAQSKHQESQEERIPVKLEGKGNGSKTPKIKTTKKSSSRQSLADLFEKKTDKRGASSSRSVGSKMSTSKSLADANGSSSVLSTKSSKRSVGSVESKLSSSSSHSLQKVKELKTRHELLQRKAEKIRATLGSSSSIARIAKIRSEDYDPYHQDIDESPSISSRRNGTFSPGTAPKSFDRWLVSKSDSRPTCKVLIKPEKAGSDKIEGEGLDKRLQDLQAKWRNTRECLIVQDVHAIGSQYDPPTTQKTFPSAG